MLVYIPNIFRFQIESLRNSPFPSLGEDQNKVQHLIILLFCIFWNLLNSKQLRVLLGFVCLILLFV